MPESIPSKGVLPAWVFAVVALVVAVLGCGRSASGPSAGAVRSAEQLRLDCEEWGRGWLAPERLAQRLDKKVMNWWDRSRHSGDPWGSLGTWIWGLSNFPGSMGPRSTWGTGFLGRTWCPGARNSSILNRGPPGRSRCGKPVGPVSSRSGGRWASGTSPEDR